MTEGGSDIEARLAFGFRLCTARAPNEKEILILRQIVEQSLSRYRQNPAAAVKLIGIGEAPRPSGIDPSELAAWTTIGNILLNLDETITKG